jgi:pimeloyl-ACP methyl ester carboxylesterase
MSFLTTKNGTNLFYNDWGNGMPVLLVHGWSIHSDSWEYMVTQLCNKGYRCITYDLRGCGRSDKPWDGYDFKTLAEDLASIIEHLNLSDLTMIGHSMGCGVICQYLADYTEAAVSQAVFIGTTTPFLSLANDNPHGLDPAFFENAVLKMRSDRPRYVHNLANGFFNLPAKSEIVSAKMVDWTMNITLQASGRASEEMYRTAWFSDLRPALTRINVPVLIQHGTKDVSSVMDLTALPTQKLIKNCELKIYEEMPHGMYISEAATLSVDIDAFISRCVERQTVQYAQTGLIY